MDKSIQDYLDEIAKILGEPVFLYCNGYLIKDYYSIPISKDGEYNEILLKISSKQPKSDLLIARFCLSQMFSCCMILVSHNSIVWTKYQNKGIGSILFKFKLSAAKKLGYSTVLCTDIENNAPQRKILAKNGFTDIYNNINSRTGNKVFISVKTIKKD